MTTLELQNLKINSFVYVFTNTGTAGVNKYQYAGIIKNVFTGKNCHVFLSEFFLSTVTVSTDMYKQHCLKRIFLTKEEAEKYKQKVIKSGLY